MNLDTKVLTSQLKSESAVLKTTVYTEFWSEWLQPWLHYIPVSQMYNELYNIFAYFSGPTESMLLASNATRGTYQSAGLTTRRLDGDAELRKIASAGRDWMFSVGRKIDMESEWPPLSTGRLAKISPKSTFTVSVSNGLA